MLPFNVPIWYNLIYIMLELSVKALYIIIIKGEHDYEYSKTKQIW
jgi:hypothetical protein